MMAAETQPEVQGELRENEPMSRHTSWRVGGSADLFFVPASIDGLSQFLHELDTDTPIFWHGVGSNLLVRDGGIRGVVISASKILKNLDRVDHYRVKSGGGVPCTQLARQCVRWSLGPAEFFANWRDSNLRAQRNSGHRWRSPGDERRCPRRRNLGTC